MFSNIVFDYVYRVIQKSAQFFALHCRTITSQWFEDRPMMSAGYRLPVMFGQK